MSDSSSDQSFKACTTVASGDGLLRAAPSSLAIDADSIVSFLDQVEKAGLDIHGFILYRQGTVAAEGYRWPYRAEWRRIMHSATKSFAACAIALALEDGLLDLNDKIVTYFPEIEKQYVSDRMARITIEDLLTMQIGHEFETSGAVWRVLDSSWIAEFFKIPLVCEPGTVFMYTSAASYILSAILSRATGQTMHDYLKPRLFEPLGITDEAWDISPDGINPGGNGLSVKLVDLLKLGILHEQKGMWNGKRLLPASWIEIATQPHVETKEYGYHWWTRPNGSYSALGRFVQMSTVHPQRGAVLAVMCAIEESALLFPFIEQYVWPACLPAGASQACAQADARLAYKLAQWTGQNAPTPWKARLEANAGSKLQGTLRYAIAPNRYGVKAIYLTLSSDRCDFTLVDESGMYTVNVGIGHWIEGRTNMPGRDLHHGYDMHENFILARAAWIDPTRLEMVWIYPETAFRDTVTARFEQSELVLERVVNINGDARRHDDLKGTRLQD